MGSFGERLKPTKPTTRSASSKGAAAQKPAPKEREPKKLQRSFTTIPLSSRRWRWRSHLLTANHLRAIATLPSVGAVGGQALFVASDHELLKSLDAGKSWARLPAPLQDCEPQGAYGAPWGEIYLAGSGGIARVREQGEHLEVTQLLP